MRGGPSSPVFSPFLLYPVFDFFASRCANRRLISRITFASKGMDYPAEGRPSDRRSWHSDLHLLVVSSHLRTAKMLSYSEGARSRTSHFLGRRTSKPGGPHLSANHLDTTNAGRSSPPAVIFFSGMSLVHGHRRNWDQNIEGESGLFWGSFVVYHSPPR